MDTCLRYLYFSVHFYRGNPYLTTGQHVAVTWSPFVNHTSPSPYPIQGPLLIRSHTFSADMEEGTEEGNVHEHTLPSSAFPPPSLTPFDCLPLRSGLRHRHSHCRIPFLSPSPCTKPSIHSTLWSRPLTSYTMTTYSSRTLSIKYKQQGSMVPQNILIL